MTKKSTAEWCKVLSDKNFRRTWIALLVGGTGTGALSIAMLWEIWSATESYFWIGASVFAFMISGLATSWLAGVLTDRHSPKTLSLVGMLGILATSAMLYMLWRFSLLDTWAMLAVMFTHGASVHLALISWRVFVPMLVEKKNLVQAARLDVGASNLGRATGPLAAVPIFLIFGVEGLFWAGILGAAVMASAVATSAPIVSISSDTSESGDALRFFALFKLSCPIISVGFCAAFMARSLWEIAAGIASEKYGSDITGYALFMAALGIGAVAAVFVFGTIGDRLSFKHAATMFCSLMSAGLLLTAVTRQSIVGYLGFCLLGAGHVAQAMSCNSETQRVSPPASRGKTLSVYIIAVSVGVSAGSLIMGALSNAVGIVTVHIAAGLILAAVSVWLVFYQKLKTLASRILAEVKVAADSSLSIEEPDLR